MSYHRTSEAAPSSGAASMTVCTNDLALCNLVEDALPVATLDTLGNAELLVSEMVELKDDRVGLPAVNARVLSQVGDEKLDAFSNHGLLSGPRLLDVSLAVGSVVLLLISGPTRAAVVVALPAGFSPPGKALQRFLLMTAPALPHEGQRSYTNRRSPSHIPARSAEFPDHPVRPRLSRSGKMQDPTGSGAVW